MADVLGTVNFKCLDFNVLVVVFVILRIVIIIEFEVVDVDGTMVRRRSRLGFRLGGTGILVTILDVVKDLLLSLFRYVIPGRLVTSGKGLPRLLVHHDLAGTARALTCIRLVNT